MWFLVVFFVSAPAACSDGKELGPDASLALLVGDWSAERFVVRNKANPSQAPELIADLGAQFTLNIQPSGQYTAILVVQGTAITEIGLLRLEGREIEMTVSFRDNQPVTGSSRSTFALSGNRLTLDGDTQFPFTAGQPVPAEAHIELVKR